MSADQAAVKPARPLRAAKVIDQPRCRSCKRKFAEWLIGVIRYDCPRCGETTILDSDDRHDLMYP